MEINKWETIDILYNESEQELADKEGFKLIKLGYVLEQQDSGQGEFDYCDQYLRDKLTKLTPYKERMEYTKNNKKFSTND